MKQLVFNRSDADDRRHYELAHVIMHSSREQLTAAESTRLGRLQDEWESHGVASESEKVIEDRDFSVPRFTLAEDGDRVEITLEDAVFDVLKKLIEKLKPMGYLQRPVEKLKEFVKTAKTVKFEQGPRLSKEA